MSTQTRTEPYGDMLMYADFEQACNMLDDLDLDSIFAKNSIEESWMRWKEVFLSIMDKCIPKVNLPDGRNLPWLAREIVNQRSKIITIERARHVADLKISKDTRAYESKANFFENLTQARVNHSGKALNISVNNQVQSPA